MSVHWAWPEAKLQDAQPDRAARAGAFSIVLQHLKGSKVLQRVMPAVCSSGHGLKQDVTMLNLTVPPEQVRCGHVGFVCRDARKVFQGFEKSAMRAACSLGAG